MEQVNPQAPMAPIAQPQQAVAKAPDQKRFRDYINLYKGKFEEILGKKAQGFVTSVISVANSPAVKGADQSSIVSAAFVAATLDLPVNPNLGFSYIVAYNDKRLGKVAQFQLGYKGFIQLAMRSGQFRTINVTDIRKGEIKSENLLSGEIEFEKLPNDKRSDAEIIGYAAYFRLNNGFEKTMYMSHEEINAHAKKYSQSYRNDRYNSSLWATQFDTMARKTVLKLLLAKYAPLSINMQAAEQYDQSYIKTEYGDASNIEEAEIVYIDNNKNEVAVTEAEQQQGNLHDQAAKILAENRRKAEEKAASEFNNNKSNN